MIPKMGMNAPKLGGQRGFAFLPFLLANWQMIAIAGLALIVGGYYLHCEHVKKDRDNIIAKQEAQLEKNRQEAITRDNISKQNEADNAKRYAALNAKYADARKRLSAHSGQAESLSAAAAILNCPNRQADLTGGLERLEGGILTLLERGDKAIERTITCRAWIEDQMKVKVD